VPKDQSTNSNGNPITHLRGKFLDQDVFVVGAGPSLRGFDWGKLDGKNTIALNNVVLCLTPTVHLFSDTNLWKNYRDHPYSERTTIVCQRDSRDDLIGWERFAPHRARCYQFDRRVTLDRIEPEDDALFVNNTVATGGVMLAWKLGAARIFLMGIDAYKLVDSSGREIYYHDGTDDHKRRRKQVFVPGHKDLLLQDRHELWIKQMQEVRKYLSRYKALPGTWPGPGVYNLSPFSQIDAWEKRDLAEVLP
jgi:hypothetical protein